MNTINFHHKLDCREPPNREYPFKDIPGLYNLINKLLLKSCKFMMKLLNFL